MNSTFSSVITSRNDNFEADSSSPDERANVAFGSVYQRVAPLMLSTDLISQHATSNSMPYIRHYGTQLFPSDDESDEDDVVFTPPITNRDFLELRAINPFDRLLGLRPSMSINDYYRHMGVADAMGISPYASDSSDDESMRCDDSAYSSEDDLSFDFDEDISTSPRRNLEPAIFKKYAPRINTESAAVDVLYEHQLLEDHDFESEIQDAQNAGMPVLERQNAYVAPNPYKEFRTRRIRLRRKYTPTSYFELNNGTLLPDGKRIVSLKEVARDSKRPALVRGRNLRARNINSKLKNQAAKDAAARRIRRSRERASRDLDDEIEVASIEDAIIKDEAERKSLSRQCLFEFRLAKNLAKEDRRAFLSHQRAKRRGIVTEAGTDYTRLLLGTLDVRGKPAPYSLNGLLGMLSPFGQHPLLMDIGGPWINAIYLCYKAESLVDIYSALYTLRPHIHNFDWMHVFGDLIKDTLYNYFGSRRRTEAYSDRLEELKSFLVSSITGDVGRICRDLLLAMASHKIFGKSTAQGLYNFFGKPTKMSILELINLAADSVISLIRFGEGYFQGLPISELFRTSNPIDAAIVEARTLLSFNGRIIFGLPVEEHMAAREFILRADPVLQIFKDYKSCLNPYALCHETIEKLKPKLLDLRTTAMNMMGGGDRLTPFGIVLHGDPGIGKSKFLYFICDILARVMGRKFNPNQIFPRVVTSEYWEQYHPLAHPVVHYSELGNITKQAANNRGDPAVVEASSLVDGVKFTPNKAFGEKGKDPALPELVIIDNNNPFMNLDQLVCNEAAYRRRFRFIEIIVKGQYRTSGTSALNSALSLADPEDQFKMDRWRIKYVTYTPMSKNTWKENVFMDGGADDDIFKFTRILELEMKTHFETQTRLHELSPELYDSARYGDPDFVSLNYPKSINTPIFYEEMPALYKPEERVPEAVLEETTVTEGNVVPRVDQSGRVYYTSPRETPSQRSTTAKTYVWNPFAVFFMTSWAIFGYCMFGALCKVLWPFMPYSWSGKAAPWYVHYKKRLCMLFNTNKIENIYETPEWDTYRSQCTAAMVALSGVLAGITVYVGYKYVKNRFWDSREVKKCPKDDGNFISCSAHAPHGVKIGELCEDCVVSRKCDTCTAPHGDEYYTWCYRCDTYFPACLKGHSGPEVCRDCDTEASSFLVAPNDSKLMDWEEKSGCDEHGARIPVKNSEIWNVQVKNDPKPKHKGSMKELYDAIRSNIRQCYIQSNTNTKAHVLGLKGNFALINTHSLGRGDVVSIQIAQTGRTDANNSITIDTLITHAERSELGNDLTVIRLQAINFRDITKHIASARCNFARYDGVLEGMGVHAQILEGVRELSDSNGPIHIAGMFQYDDPLHYPGKCGQPLIIESDGAMIAGIHVGGVKGFPVGYSTPISMDIITPAINAMIASSVFMPINSSSPIELESLLEPAVKSAFRYEVLHGVNYFGRVPGAIILPNESSLIKSPFFKAADDMIEEELGYISFKRFGPPMMRPQMKKGVYISPFNITLKKMSSQRAALNPDILERVISEIVNRAVARMGKLYPLTMEEAINGVIDDPFTRRINVHTGSGFGLRGKKSVHLPIFSEDEQRLIREPTSELKGQIMRILDHYDDEEMSNFIFSACPKDEAREMEKVLSGKTRMFYMSTLASLIISRMYLSPFYTAMVADGDLFCTAVGINPHSGSDDIVKRFKSFSEKLFEGDYEKYDVRMPFLIGYAASTIVYRVLERCGYNVEALKVVRGLQTDTLFPFVELLNDILQVVGLQPSGMYATAENNSLRGLVLLMYFFYSQPGSKGLYFFDVVLPLLYGDDVLASVKDFIADWFNNLTYRTFCEQSYYMGFTAAAKGSEMEKFMTISTCSFLKRNFVYSHEFSRWIAPLSIDSILKSLKWVLPSKSEPLSEQMRSIFTSALWELFLHTNERQYNAIRTRLVQMLDGRFGSGHDVLLPTRGKVFSSIF